MDFDRFEHAAWLAHAWREGPPRHNLGASGLHADWTDRLPTRLEASDVSGLDLHAQIPFRDALAARWDLSPERLRVAAGTTGANTAVLLALVRPGCNVVCERPCYAPLPHLARGLGAEVRFVDREPSEGWRLDPAAVAEAVDDDTALVLLASPNNPTGAVATDADLRTLGDAAAGVGARVLVDQVYRELTDHPVAARVHDACITTAGFNKAWGAPGLRTGWVAGTAADMERVEEVARLALLAPVPLGTRLGMALLAREDEARAALEARLAQTHAVYREWCLATDREAEAAAPRGLTAFPSVSDDGAVAEAGLRRGLLVIPGSGFGRPGHVRVGLGIEPAALAEGLRVLDEVTATVHAQTL